MPRMLGRSKSLRMLRGLKETQLTPPPANSQVDLDRLKAATPATIADGRVETSDMSERPKTSGGPGDRKLFHKKVAPIAPGSEHSDLNFPFASPSNKSTTTILYTAEVHEDREGIIGIALGSPTMNPNWNSTPRSTDFVTSNSGIVTYISSNTALPETATVKQEASKPKLSRWRSIFGKKPQPSPEPKPSFYQLAQSVIPARADSHHDNESLNSHLISQAEVYSDHEDRSGSPPAFKPDIRESRKVPKGQEQPLVDTRPRALTTGNPPNKSKKSLMRSASSPKPPPKDYSNNSPTIPQVIVSGGSQVTSPRMDGEMSLLDVDIPSIKMERYSVMFGNLLQPNSNRSSSLLVRRQGNSERLKPLNELSVKKEEDGPRNGNLKPQRRATSPSYPKSPSVSLSLFPNTAGNSRAPSPRTVSVHRPRPLQRSKTAPASSPNRQNFPIPSPSNGGAKEAYQDTKPKDESPESEDTNQKSQLLTPTPSRHSFASDSEDVTIIVGRTSDEPWKPLVDEPEWEIVSKPTLVSRPSQRMALSSHPINAPLQDGPSSAPLEARADILIRSKTQTTPRSADRTYTPKSLISPKPQTPSESQTTTVGVARSVSVSRAVSPRSADLLQPTLVRRLTERSLSPGLGERLVDHKPLTPTLVELRNRKSQRVQLVDA